MPAGTPIQVVSPICPRQDNPPLLGVDAKPMGNLFSNTWWLYLNKLGQLAATAGNTNFVTINGEQVYY